MDINLSISPAPSVTLRLVTRVFAASAPTVIVAVNDQAPPHTSPRNISFTGLNTEVYIVNIYETSAVGVTGTLRHSFIYDPTFQQASFKDAVYLVFTGGEIGHSDATWADWDIALVVRNATGPLASPSQIIWAYNADPIPRVIGFNLAQSGDEFAPGEQVVVTFKPRISTTATTINSAKPIVALTTITASRTLTAADSGKGLLVQGASNVINLALPAIGSISTFLPFYFISDGGAHVSLAITVASGGNIRYLGTRSVLRLIQGERATLIYTGAEYIVLGDIHGVLRVGELVNCFDKDSSVQGCLFADGALVDRLEYARLWEFIQQLDSSLLVSDTSWNTGETDKGRFSMGDGSTTFRLPRLYAAGFIKAVDGSARLAGSREEGSVKNHQHITPSVGADNPPDGLNAYGKATSIAASFSAWFRAATTARRDLVSNPVDTTGAAVGTSENLVTNTGAYILIRY